MRKLKYAAVFLISFAVALSLILLFQTKNTSSLKKAPDFSITTFEGDKMTLSKINQNKVVVVNFWASWCPSCREEAPDLEKVWRQYKDRIYFIGIDIKDTKKDALAYIKEFDITYPNSFDESGISQDYGITGVPETFIIKDGLIYDHIIGATTVSDLSKRIEEVL